MDLHTWPEGIALQSSQGDPFEVEVVESLLPLLPHLLFPPRGWQGLTQVTGREGAESRLPEPCNGFCPSHTQDQCGGQCRFNYSARVRPTPCPLAISFPPTPFNTNRHPLLLHRPIGAHVRPCPTHNQATGAWGRVRPWPASHAHAQGGRTGYRRLEASKPPKSATRLAHREKMLPRMTPAQMT
jgi:hypothetical protein